MFTVKRPYKEGVKDLEDGLQTLAKSKLMAVPEFKSMYLAIEKHTRDAKLAHLTGKPKDIQYKTERDTKFYIILVQMLAEVENRSMENKRESLKQVHSWYRTNRHVLLCGPRFGKTHTKDESKEIEDSLVIPLSTKIVRSALLGASCEFSHAEKTLPESKDDEVRHEPKTTSTDVSSSEEIISSENVWPEEEEEEEGEEEEGSPTNDEQSTVSTNLNAGNIADLNEFNPEHHSVFNKEEETVNQDEPTEKHYDQASLKSSSSTTNVLDNPVLEKPSTLTPHLGQPKNIQKANPIYISALIEPVAEKILVSKQTSDLPAQDRSAYRAQSCQAWQTFKKQRSQEQEAANRLNFLGRSGTAIDVRYSAHDNGEQPEAYTLDILENFLRQTSSSKKEQHRWKGNVFTEKTLQDFYETVENIHPKSWKTFKNSLSAKLLPSLIKEIKEKTKNKTSKEKESKLIQDYGLNFEHILAKLLNETKKTSQKDTGISMQAMINIIDSVKDHMTCYKEKFVPEPLLGFHQPSDLTITRDQSSLSSCDITTLDYGSLTPSVSQVVISNRGSQSNRPFSSPLTNSTCVNKDMVDERRETKIRCVSAEVIDWRGWVTPEVTQGKWSKSVFSGHTYVNKGYRTSSRSFGCTSAGGRPRTAQMMIKDKWKVQQQNDKDKRAIQASSHNTTIVDQTDVDSMIQIQHLLTPGRSFRCNSLDSFEFENFQTEKRKQRAVTSEPQVLEYLSFISTSVQELDPKSDVSSYKGSKVEERQQNTHSFNSDLEHDNVDTFVAHDDNETLDAKVEKEMLGSQRNCSRLSHTSETHKSEVKQRQPDSDRRCKSGRLGSGNYRTNMATKVQRSAGRMPDHVTSTSAHLQTFSQLQNNAMRGISLVRTPASIPSSRKSSRRFTTKSGQVFVELEHHARKTRNPSEYLNNVESLRSTEHPKNISLTTGINLESFPGTSFQISKIPTPSRSYSSTSFSKNFATRTEVQYSPENSHRSTAAGECLSDALKNTFVDRSMGCTQTSPKSAHTPSTSETSSPNYKFSNRTGRPLAEVFQTQDPYEIYQAVQMQKEAAAAVDIQRIFRGYVARSSYKSLLSEERQRVEEERKAAVRIQRLYRNHVRRKQAIYDRSPVNQELVQWSRDLSETQAKNAVKRQTKLANYTSEIQNKHRETKSKLSVIGPHVEVYSAYHQKVTGPTKHELNTAATKIQKIVRGWLLRRKIQKLAKKAIWYGSSFSKLAHDYKTMLKRVQQQHGVDKPKTPFNLKDFNVYIDLRRRYENVFETRSFGGELELGGLEAYFKECDLYPSRTEVEEAIDVTTHGQASRKDKKGITKKELMNVLFYIYVPPATGLRDTRKSTWMNPIINGQEARQMLGSEFVEPAPLAPCLKLVIDAKRAQRQREQAQKDAELRARIEEAEKRIDVDKKANKKSKKVMFQ